MRSSLPPNQERHIRSFFLCMLLYACRFAGHLGALAKDMCFLSQDAL